MCSKRHGYSTTGTLSVKDNLVKKSTFYIASTIFEKSTSSLKTTIKNNSVCGSRLENCIIKPTIEWNLQSSCKKDTLAHKFLSRRNYPEKAEVGSKT